LLTAALILAITLAAKATLADPPTVDRLLDPAIGVVSAGQVTPR
jgi:hypothetical protein